MPDHLTVTAVTSINIDDLVPERAGVATMHRADRSLVREVHFSTGHA